MYVTTEEIAWHRSFSAIPDPIIFPKGTKVLKNNDNTYFISTDIKYGRVVNHDLIHYGCRVPEEKVCVKSE